MKNLIKNAILILCSAVILFSCGNSSDSSSNMEPEKKAQSSDGPKYDRSSPEATFKTLVTASNEKDKEGLSLCFSKESPGEFENIVNKSLSEKQLNEIKEMFGNATIKSFKSENGQALLSVSLSNRDEEIKLKKENDNWVILDF